VHPELLSIIVETPRAWVVIGLLVALPAATTAQDLPLAPDGATYESVTIDQLLANLGSLPEVELAGPAEGVLEAERNEASRSLQDPMRLGVGVGPAFGAESPADVSFEAGISQEIPLGPERARALDAIDATEALALQGQSAVEATLAVEVRDVFRRAQVALASIALSESAFALATEVHDVARRRFEAGAASAFDVDVARAEMARAEQRLRADEMTLRSLGSELAAVSGWPGATVPVPADGALDVQCRDLTSGILAASLEEHPALAVADAHVAVTATGIGVAEAERVPDITVGLGLDSAGEGGIRRNTIMATLEVPLRFGGSGNDEIAHAEALLDRATLERDLQERALARQLAPAIADFGGACARLRASDALVVAPAEVERERILQAFEQGGVDLLDVLDGSARLLAARQEVIDAQGAYVAAVSAIERVLLIDFSALATETP
jgi:cobalt-zinc-cadmium efflux system outer membrane protein